MSGRGGWTGEVVSEIWGEWDVCAWEGARERVQMNGWSMDGRIRTSHNTYVATTTAPPTHTHAHTHTHTDTDTRTHAHAGLSSQSRGARAAGAACATPCQHTCVSRTCNQGGRQAGRRLPLMPAYSARRACCSSKFAYLARALQAWKIFLKVYFFTGTEKTERLRRYKYKGI